MTNSTDAGTPMSQRRMYPILPLGSKRPGGNSGVFMVWVWSGEGYVALRDSSFHGVATLGQRTRSGLRGSLEFIDDSVDLLAGLAQALLQAAVEFILFAFLVEEVVICQFGKLLLQLAFGFVPVALRFQA